MTLFLFMKGANMRKKLKQYAPLFLSALAGIGVVGTAILSSKATIKYEQIQKECDKENTPLDKVRIAAPIYLPTIALSAATIVCIFGSSMLNRRQQASLISAYAMLNQAYKDYKNKVIELYGEDTHRKIVETIAIEKAKDVHISAPTLMTNCDLAIEQNDGSPKLFYDEYSNRYFEKTIEQVLTAEYHLNRNYCLCGGVSLNEFYEFLGLKPTDIGESLGWSIDDEVYWIDFNHYKVTLDDGLECYILEMPFGPSAGYLDD